MIAPVEFRVLFFVSRDGEPSARLHRVGASKNEHTLGNVVAVAETLLQAAEIYEKSVELEEALQAEPFDASKMVEGLVALEAVGGADPLAQLETELRADPAKHGWDGGLDQVTSARQRFAQGGLVPMYLPGADRMTDRIVRTPVEFVARWREGWRRV